MWCVFGLHCELIISISSHVPGQANTMLSFSEFSLWQIAELQFMVYVLVCSIVLRTSITHFWQLFFFFFKSDQLISFHEDRLQTLLRVLFGRCALEQKQLPCKGCKVWKKKNIKVFQSCCTPMLLSLILIIWFSVPTLLLCMDALELI